MGVVEPERATALASNRGKGVWRIDSRDGPFALRVLRPGEHATAEYEATAMDHARQGGVPVPDLVATGTTDDRPVMLLGWCEGRTLAQDLRRRPWRAFDLGRRCGRAQAALHDVAPPDALVPWIDRFGAPDAALAGKLEVVAAGDSLLHLDLHAHNVLVGDGAISAIVDWTNAGRGDPRADLARSWSLLVLEGSSGRLVRRAGYAVVRVGWRRGYESSRGRQASFPLFQLWAIDALVRLGDGADSSTAARRLRRRADRLRRRVGRS